MKKSELKQLIKECINELTDAQLQALHDDPVQRSARASSKTWVPKKNSITRVKPTTPKEPKERVKRDIPPKLSKSEFIRLCKTTAWAAKEATKDSKFDDDDTVDYEGSALVDIVRDEVLYSEKTKNYLRYVIEKENPYDYKYYYPRDEECINYMMNQVEQYM